MRSHSVLSSALAAPLLLILPLITRGTSATNTTSVQNGDTFLAIADNAGIPVESLEAANPGVVATELYVGQAITIPVNNEAATGVPASSTPQASALTASVNSASPSVVSKSSPSSSPEATSSPSSTDGSSVTTSSTSAMVSSETSSPISTSISSTQPSTSTATSVPTSSPPTSTTSAPPSSTPTSTTSTPPSSTPPTSSPPPSTTPASAAPSTTTAAPPTNSPPTNSCRPSPTGKYHDATDVSSKTANFCSTHNDKSILDILSNPGGVVDGSSQNNNNDGSTPDEEGYNMTITAISGCNITGATVGVPFPGEEGQYNCTGLLFNAWKTCYSNDGMGGSMAAGCFIYAFDPDS